MNKAEVLKKFHDLGVSASYHFADDSGSEWGSGYRYQNEAMELFEQYPEWQEDFRAVADFLWSLDSAIRDRAYKREKGIL